MDGSDISKNRIIRICDIHEICNFNCREPEVNVAEPFFPSVSFPYYLYVLQKKQQK